MFFESSTFWGGRNWRGGLRVIVIVFVGWFLVALRWWNCHSRYHALRLRQVLHSESSTTTVWLMLWRRRVGSSTALWLLGLLLTPQCVPHALGHALYSQSTTTTFGRLGTQSNAGGAFVVTVIVVVSTRKRSLSQSCWAGRFRRCAWLASLVGNGERLDLCRGGSFRFERTPRRIAVVPINVFVVLRGRARR